MAVDSAAMGKSGPGSPSKNAVADGEYALAPLTETIGFLTRVVQVQIMDRIRAAGGFGMSMAGFSVLRLVNANPGIRQAHIARILVIQESNMVNLVKDMIEQGFIERRGEGKTKRGGLWITDGNRATGKRSLAEQHRPGLYLCPVG